MVSEGCRILGGRDYWVSIGFWFGSWSPPCFPHWNGPKKWVVSYLVDSGDERIPDSLDSLNPYSMLLYVIVLWNFPCSPFTKFPSLATQILHPLLLKIQCVLLESLCCPAQITLFAWTPKNALVRIPMFAPTPSEVTLKISLKWLKLIGKWWWTIQFWGRLFLRQSLSKSPRPGHRSGRHFFISAIDDPILPRSVSMWPNHTGHHRSIGHLNDWTQRRIGGGTKKTARPWPWWWWWFQVGKKVQTTITILNTFWDNSSNHQK